jgi:hypothetical protein
MAVLRFPVGQSWKTKFLRPLPNKLPTKHHSSGSSLVKEACSGMTWCPIALTALREATLGVPRHAAGSDDSDVDAERQLTVAPPPLALNPHVVVGARDVGRERAAKSMPPRSLNSHQEGQHYTQGDEPPTTGELAAFFPSPRGNHGVSSGRSGAPFIGHHLPSHTRTCLATRGQQLAWF